MNALEEQADNAKARELFWKPMSWLEAIRPTSANNASEPALWATFVFTTLGLGAPVLSSLHLHMHSSLRCNQGARLVCPYWGRCSARPDTRYVLNME